MYQRISKKEAQDKINQSNSILLDIRDTESFEDGHVEQAIHLTQDKLATFIFETEKTTPILVMCYHGNSSQSVAQYLTQNGFLEVYSIDGGYEGWINN